MNGTGTQVVLDQLLFLRQGSVGKYIQDALTQVCIVGGNRKELFAGALVKSYGVQFRGGHSPPAGKHGAGEQAGNEVFPYEGLHVFRNDEVLFRLSEDVRQIGQRSHQMSSASRRPATAEQERRMPGLVAGYNGQPGEIVVAHKKRVIVEHLRAGRLIVGVVQAHQSVS